MTGCLEVSKGLCSICAMTYGPTPTPSCLVYKLQVFLGSWLHSLVQDVLEIAPGRAVVKPSGQAWHCAKEPSCQVPAEHWVQVWPSPPKPALQEQTLLLQVALPSQVVGPVQASVTL